MSETFSVVLIKVCLHLLDSALVLNILALLIGVAFMLTLPRQIELSPAALIEWYEQVCTEVSVAYVYLGIPHLLLRYAQKMSGQPDKSHWLYIL